MKTFDSTQAMALLAAALGSARQHQLRPMGVVVVDTAGQVVASAREAGATALRLDIALGKAAAAIGMGISSRVLAGAAKDLPVFFSSVASVAQQKFIPHTGAVVLKDADGTVIGAVGASGGTGDDDEKICIEGAQAVGLTHA